MKVLLLWRQELEPMLKRFCNLFNGFCLSDLSHFAHEDTLVHVIRKLSSYNDHTGDMKPAYHDDPIRCYAFLAPSDKFGIRANTVATYCDINRKVS
jgi:hypothetical protein